MNIKTKLTLLSASLSCAVLAAAGTSTFAWFTINKQVSINHSTLSVASTSANVSVSVTQVTPKPASDDPATVNATEANTSITTAAKISDCSSDFGGAFVVLDNGVADTYKTLALNEYDNHVFRYGLTVKNMPTKGQSTFKLNIGWENGDTDDASYYILRWLRVGLIECTNSTFDPSTAAEDALKGAWVFSTSLNNKYIDVNEQKTIASTSLHARGSDAILYSAAEQETHYYLMSVWMEGTATADEGLTHDMARGGKFKINTQVKAD